MEIEKFTIRLESEDEDYFREIAGIKPNKVCFFHSKKEIDEILNFQLELQEEIKYIEIFNRRSPHLCFRRQLRDVSRVNDMWSGSNLCFVFSWFHEENGVQDGFNAPIKGWTHRRAHRG